MNIPDTYHTLAGESRGEYQDRGSKFLAFAFPVHDTIEIRSILDGLRKVRDTKVELLRNQQEK